MAPINAIAQPLFAEIASKPIIYKSPSPADNTFCQPLFLAISYKIQILNTVKIQLCH
jgi:hypothetical protein